MKSRDVEIEVTVIAGPFCHHAMVDSVVLRVLS
jgi:hypothetical protein